mgnify:CR=1 FL=1
MPTYVFWKNLQPEWFHYLNESQREVKLVVELYNGN